LRWARRRAARSAAQALDHHAEHHQRELGLLLQRGGELPVVESDHAARGLRQGGGAARRIADRRHLAEDLADLHRAERPAFGGQPDLAVQQQVHLVAPEQDAACLLVLSEEHGAGSDRFLLADRFEKCARDGGR
jgi:hypothetical protein